MIEQQQPTTQKQTHNSEYPQFYTMPVLLLDLDGTVRKTIQTESPFIQNTEDQQLNGDIEKRIWHYRDRGYFVAAVSNQGGVAMGFKKEEDVMKELAHFATLFEKYPFHWQMTALSMPTGTVYPFNHRSLLRKPEIGMLAVLEHECWKRDIVIDWDNSLMVGDRPEDQQLAERAGVAYLHIDEFLKLPIV